MNKPKARKGKKEIEKAMKYFKDKIDLITEAIQESEGSIDPSEAIELQIVIKHLREYQKT